MGTNRTSQKRRKHKDNPRADRLAREWAAAVHVELLAAWGRSDDGPMPTRADAEKVARERVDLLIDGLGEWADASPKLLDLSEKTVRRGRRGWSRNAWPKERRDDGDGSRWWYRFFRDEDDC